MEIEKDGELPFLDILVKQSNTKLTTLVYRKPTHTYSYLNFKSHHHPRVKAGIVKCLTHRAQAISDPMSLSQARRSLHSIHPPLYETEQEDNGRQEKRREDHHHRQLTEQAQSPLPPLR